VVGWLSAWLLLRRFGAPRRVSPRRATKLLPGCLDQKALLQRSDMARTPCSTEAGASRVRLEHLATDDRYRFSGGSAQQTDVLFGDRKARSCLTAVCASQP